MIIPDEWDIRPRAVLIAALPTMVMALVLIAYFTSSRLSDLEDAHVQRGKALARQLAAASEYGVFSGNLESLRKQANALINSETIREMLLEAFERLQRARELHLGPGAAGIPFMRIHAIGEKQATIPNRSLRGVLSQGFKPRQCKRGSKAFEEVAA